MKQLFGIGFFLTVFLLLAGILSAEDQVRKANPPSQAEQVAPAQPAPVVHTAPVPAVPPRPDPLNIVWTLICAFLVFFMQAGFAMVEAGFTRAKNAGHTMAMNMMVLVFAVLGYWICGYAFQTGTKGFFLSGGVYNVSVITLFLSQAVYLNIAATIPTGAMA
jgi:hypothetical protein